MLAELVADGQDLAWREATLAVEPARRLSVGHALPVPVDVGEDIGPFHAAIIAPPLARGPITRWHRPCPRSPRRPATCYTTTVFTLKRGGCSMCFFTAHCSAARTSDE
jgi:hypothetical protein